MLEAYIQQLWKDSFPRPEEEFKLPHLITWVKISLKCLKSIFEDLKGDRKLVWQTSWGLTTRSIGILTMIHGDDKGLVLPPRIAPIQVVVVPILMKNKDIEAILAKARDLTARLKAQSVAVHCDDRENYNPGWKFNHWELKGVPIRLELGPKDFDNNQVVLVRRDNGQKTTVPMDQLETAVQTLMDDIQRSLLEKATKIRDEHIVEVTEWSQFLPALDGKNIALAPWCSEEKCEDDVKKRSAEEAKKNTPETSTSGPKLTGAAKTLCIPFNQKALSEEAKCFACGQKAKNWTLFGRSY